MKTGMRALLGAVLVSTVAFTSTAFAGEPDRREDRREHRVHREPREHTRYEERRESDQRREALARRERERAEQRRIERQNREAWERMRAERAAMHRREIARVWAIALRTPAGQAELTLHANRMARLHRVRDIGVDTHNTALIAKVDRLIEIENARSLHVLGEIARSYR